MFVRMRVTLGEMQPNAQRHQRSGDQQLHIDYFAQQRNRQQRTEERCDREIGASSCRTEMAQRSHK